MGGIGLGYCPGERGGGGGGTANANVFEIVNLFDVPAAAAVGDYAFVTGAAGMYRLKSLTFPTVGARDCWVFAEDYGLTTTGVGLIIGTEDAAQLALQGATVASGANATVTTDGTTVTIATTAIGNTASLSYLVGSLLAASRWRLLGEIWGDTPSTGDIGYIVAGDTSSNDFALYNSVVATPVGFQPVNGSAAAFFAVSAFAQSGPSYLPTVGTTVAPTVLGIIDDGATVGASVRRGGAQYCPVRRISSGVPTFPNGITIAASSGAGGGSYNLHIRRSLIYTVS